MQTKTNKRRRQREKIYKEAFRKWSTTNRECSNIPTTKQSHASNSIEIEDHEECFGNNLESQTRVHTQCMNAKIIKCNIDYIHLLQNKNRGLKTQVRSDCEDVIFFHLSDRYAISDI